MADLTTAILIPSGPTSGEAEHEPSALGISAGGWVAIGMLIVFAIAIFMKAPSIITGMLDKKIAGIRDQLATAEQLRRGETDVQRAGLARSGRRVTQRALEERAEHEADAGGGGANTDRRDTGADDLSRCEFHILNSVNV
jgi:F-type H+-transporting ATPase subunit b